MGKTLAYLASPYNHPDPEVRKMRHKMANITAAHLISKGIFVISPLTHNIPLFEVGLRQGWDLWKDYDFTLVQKCDKLIVLKLPGWEESQGVTDEINLAKKHEIPIEYMDPPLQATEPLIESLKKGFGLDIMNCI